MKILFLSSIPAPYQLDFARAVNAEVGVQMRLYFLNGREENRDWNLDLKEGDIAIADYSGKISDYAKFLAYAREYDPDVILIGGHSLPLAGLALAYSVFSRTRIFYWLERPLPAGFLKNIARRIYLGLKLPFASGVFGIGREAVRIYGRYARKIFNLPYSLDLNPFLATKRSSSKKLRFVFIGQLIDRKNILSLVSAFRTLPRDLATLAVVGSGPLFEALLAADVPGVELLGFVEPKDLPSILAEQDVFVLPSKHDGWGVVVNEAMASGMPVISTPEVGAAKEYIRHLENGYICDPDPASIQAALLYYIERKQEIARQGAKNRELISASLGNARHAARFLIQKLHD